MKLLTEKQIIRNKMPFASGKYLLFLLDEKEIVYIGKVSKSVPNLFGHSDKDFTDYYILKIDEAYEQEDYETIHAEYIMNLLPRYNITLPNNGRYMTKNQIKNNFGVNGYEINKLLKKKGITTIFQDYYDIREIFGA